MIQKKSSIPLYYQIEEYIRSLIMDGTIKSGDSLPSEREYSERFKVSRMTVRQAIINLTNRGLLVRYQGKGTFVAQKKIEIPLMDLTSFSEDMKQRGIEPATIINDFSIISAFPQLGSIFSITQDEKVYQVGRLRLADNIPMAYETLYIPCEILPGLSKEIFKNSLYDYMEKESGLIIGRAYQTIEPGIASAQDSQLLAIDKNTPVLLIERTSYLESGNPFEYVKSIYRGDRFKMVASMTRR